jgi:biopolymer transport protein ExbD
MRRYSKHTAFHTLSEINVTPLLDLAFVLLIIFMITTPLLENSIDLVVPSSSTARNTVNPSEVQTVSIDRNEVMKLNRDVVTTSQLLLALQQIKLSQPQVAVVVRPHRDLPIQKFIGVMDLLQQAGITKVGVMTQQEKQP